MHLLKFLRFAPIRSDSLPLSSASHLLAPGLARAVLLAGGLLLLRLCHGAASELAAVPVELKTRTKVQRRKVKNKKKVVVSFSHPSIFQSFGRVYRQSSGLFTS